jgi:uncharacterized protein YihD (DUF1040 family)
MRDPARINDIVELLGEVWRHEPDLRLGQLVFNAARIRSPNIEDIYSIEDSELKKGLSRYLELMKSKGATDDTV